VARKYAPPEWSAARDFDFSPEELYPPDAAQQERANEQERHFIEGQTWREWWDEMHYQAKIAGSGQAFKEAVERDGAALSRDEGNTITLHSARGAYGTFVGRDLIGAESDQAYEKFMSTLDHTKLPGHIEVARSHSMDRVHEFWNLADKSQTAEKYQAAIEQAGYVLAKQDDKILVVTKDCVVDDLHRLTPAIAGNKDISDYGKFIAPIAAQQLPSMRDAQAIQDQRQGRDPELAPLLRELDARQYREALDLSDKHERMAELVYGDKPASMVRQHEEAREKQTEDFRAERARYIEDYLEARRLREEMEAEEKSESLKHEEEWDKGPGYSL
jgi:hypothetical protein